MIKAPKKLIEVALPLDDINEAAAREKSNPFIKGHPKKIHMWWAPRPLTAARAVIFAQMVNDPGGERGWSRGLSKEQAAAKREYLFNIIRDLVKWENTNNEEVLERARAAIWESWRETCEMNRGEPGFDPNKLPAFHDPFAGGGSIPLEAQRLGLESYASDLNPVAVMINKAMIEIPPKFANMAPVGAIPKGESDDCSNCWKGAAGLAEDVHRYGYWMREEAKKRIGHLYPQVEITKEMAKDRPDLKQYIGKKLTVIAWLWARTVKSPNPQFSDVDVPLVSSFILSSKKGKEAYVEPVVEGDGYRFEVHVGKPPKGAEMGTTAGKRKAFKCLMSGVPVDYDYIRDFGKKVGLGQKMFAVVLDGPKGRIYINASHEMESIALAEKPRWRPSTQLPDNPRDFKTPNYGLNTYGDLFTDRQLVALNTFSDLVKDAQAKATADAKAAGWEDDGKPLCEGGTGATAYGDALAVYLTFGISQFSRYFVSFATWNNSNQNIAQGFSRQAIPMTWDFPESNAIDGVLHIGVAINWVVEALNVGNIITDRNGYVTQHDAQSQGISHDKVISTDPPYYDNIGYADLSDYFFLWHKRCLNNVFPSLYVTLATPKKEELVATPYRHGGKEAAEKFFEDGMTLTMRNLAGLYNPAFPVSIYYAFKQSETDQLGTANTGWETFLQSLINAGFVITGTWPLRTEKSVGLKGSINALASSIVLVCRKRSENAETISRAQFNRELRAAMFDALEDMTNAEGTQNAIAAVDLAQAAIGPGMGVYSKYAAVLKSDGSKLSVHEAMIEINREVDRYLHPDGQSYDPSTNFFVTWFETHGYGEGAFGEADVLARAKGTTVDYVVASGVAESKGGKMRIFHYSEYDDVSDYDPKEDGNLPLWEACHRVIRELEKRNRRAAATLLSKMPEKTADIRQLAYYLYTYCEKHGDATNARAYNALITSWSEIAALMSELSDAVGKETQGELGI